MKEEIIRLCKGILNFSVSCGNSYWQCPFCDTTILFEKDSFKENSQHVDGCVFVYAKLLLPQYEKN